MSLGRRTSCDRFIEAGTRGFVVGTLIGRDAGVPVINMIRAHRSEGFRLPDGYKLPPPGPLCLPSADVVCIED